MKTKFYILSDFRENFNSAINNNSRNFNDHPTKESVEQICELINSIGYECEIWGGVYDLIHAIDNKTKMPEGIYINMSDGLIQEYNRTQIPILADILNIKYTGGNSFIVSLLSNKHYCKLAVKEYGFLVPDGILCDRSYPLKKDYINRFKYPVIIKPNTDGSSLGITKNNICNSFTEVEKKYKELSNKYNEIIIEEFIPGYELTNMYIGDYDNEILNEIMFYKKDDVIFFHKDILSIDDKCNKNIQDVYPKDLVSNEIIAMIKNQTRNIVKYLHIKDICRIDYRLTREGELYLLEINSVPRLSITTNTVLMAKMNNMSFEELIKRYLIYLDKRLNHD